MIPRDGSSSSAGTPPSTGRAGAARSRNFRPTTRCPIWTTPRTQWPNRLDGAHYRDDVLRLLFICCHPDLPATQQIALALRIVCGLTVPEIARAFLVGESAMEQRITRAKARVARADVPFEPPTAPERAERLASVATVVYLMFNEGYSATGGEAHIRTPLCGGLLMQLGRADEARTAFDRAIARARTPAEALHIRALVDRLVKEARARS